MTSITSKVLELVRAEETGILLTDLIQGMPPMGLRPAVLRLQVMASVEELRLTRKIAVLGGLLFPL